MEDEAYERSLCSYTNKSQRFLFKKKRKFDLQYSQLYAVRLMAMKQRLRTAAHKKWGDQVEIKQLASIKENEKCVIIGTIFRKMELQPSILKEISQEVYYFYFSKICFCNFFNRFFKKKKRNIGTWANNFTLWSLFINTQ